MHGQDMEVALPFTSPRAVYISSQHYTKTVQGLHCDMPYIDRSTKNTIKLALHPILARIRCKVEQLMSSSLFTLLCGHMELVGSLRHPELAFKKGRPVTSPLEDRV